MSWITRRRRVYRECRPKSGTETEPQREAKVTESMTEPQREAKVTESMTEPQRDAKVTKSMTEPQRDAKVTESMTETTRGKGNQIYDRDRASTRCKGNQIDDRDRASTRCKGNRMDVENWYAFTNLASWKSTRSTSTIRQNVTRKVVESSFCMHTTPL